MRKKGQRVKELVHKALELPPELSGRTRIVLLGNREISIQNFKGIVSYEDTFVRLNTADFMLCIRGEGLQIQHINDEDTIVSGTICGIEIE